MASEVLRLTLSHFACLLRLPGLGSTMVALMLFRLTSSKDKSPLPPPMSRTPLPPANVSLPKVSIKNLHVAAAIAQDPAHA